MKNENDNVFFGRVESKRNLGNRSRKRLVGFATPLLLLLRLLSPTVAAEKRSKNAHALSLF